MPKFSETDFDDGSAFDILQSHGFFAYSGADGDLLRKNGLPGWRVSVYGNYLIRIQRKSEHGVWGTKRKWEVEFGEELPEEALAEFDEALGEIFEEHAKN